MRWFSVSSVVSLTDVIGCTSRLTSILQEGGFFDRIFCRSAFHGLRDKAVIRGRDVHNLEHLSLEVKVEGRCRLYDPWAVMGSPIEHLLDVPFPETC